MIDCTTVVAIDAKHLDQWRITWPTWARHRPELMKWPLLVITDPLQIPRPDLSFLQHPNLAVVQWPWKVGEDFETQREKMLSAFVHIPAHHVQTEYYLKLDTDVVAMRPGDWVQDKWFENNPVYVAKGWSYTKPPWHMVALDDWGDAVHDIAKYPRLNLEVATSGNKICHKRMISWCMFARTEWTKRISAYCKFPRLPVPSQDNFIWYVAERTGEETLTTNMKRHGWSWQSTMKNIRARAEEAMA